MAILELLQDGEFQLATIERLGMEQANVSQHVSILRNKQIVLTRKVGYAGVLQRTGSDYQLGVSVDEGPFSCAYQWIRGDAW